MAARFAARNPSLAAFFVPFARLLPERDFVPERSISSPLSPALKALAVVFAVSTVSFTRSEPTRAAPTDPFIADLPV